MQASGTNLAERAGAARSARGTRTLGVVGHVDHGKTALVRALTGIETDRLAEERARGLSIVLGFAHFEVAGCVVDLIDVPGHEAFIRAMVAGATGLDGILLVVAANEGVQPQTREHLAIARLLGLGHGAVVLTKSDLVDTTTLASVRNEVARLVEGTFLEAAPVIPVSATSGRGIDELKAAVAELPVHDTEQDQQGVFCLPLDRVFTMRGFGVVGTGTVRSGRVTVGDQVEILPRRLRASVRGLQRHGKAIGTVASGQRVALNLRGVDRSEIERGEVVATVGALTPTSRIDAWLELLSDASIALSNGANLRLLMGTTDVAAKIRLLDSQQLERGGRALVQLRCAAPVVCQRGERFIVRRDSPGETLGGGRVIDAVAPRRRRFDPSVIAELQRASSGASIDRVAHLLDAAGGSGMAVSNLLADAAIDQDTLRSVAVEIGASWIGDQRLLGHAAASGLLAAIRSTLAAYHRANPMRRGISISELVSSIGASVAVTKWAVEALRELGEIAGTPNRLHMAGFDPLTGLSDAERKTVRGVAEQFLRGGIEPPSLTEINARSKALQAVVKLLLETGELVRLQTTDRNIAMALHTDVLEAVQAKLSERYPYPERFAVKDARDLLRSTRKFVLPVLEHLDAIGFTLRLGDQRQLRQDSGGE